MRYLLFIVFLCVSCGSEGASALSADIPTQSIPVVSRIVPTTAAAGDQVTIFGLGFSIAPTKNIISIGNAEVAAESYALVSPPVAGEIESITFRVPAGIIVGANSIFVTVEENTSNANLNLNIN